MMGLFLGAYDEEKKEVVIEFVSIASVSSTKSEVLMGQVQEILLNNNIEFLTLVFQVLMVPIQYLVNILVYKGESTI